MIREFWINLPVKDIKRSKEFFTRLGFSFNTQHGNTDHSLSLVIGQKNVIVMLFDETNFKSFTGCEVADISKSAETLLSFDAESKEEVDAMAKKAVEAGGRSSHKPHEMNGWMYGCLFTDPDGHRWNVLYMDMSKMPKK